MSMSGSQNGGASDQPEKFDLSSLDIAEEKRQELLRLFPEVRTEGGKLDFERLKLALGEMVDVGRERYGMNWPGKADCFRTIQQPSQATLRPCLEESVDFDTTGNMIIEGDNLEVLKLLQKSYLGKIKLIYIDPPYNTGNDFIYPDNYSESLATYLEYTGQVDSQGQKFGTNAEADGRFHSKWLNMMYTRLYLAWNLLADDGAIFISIDDNEHVNLVKLCNDIFGEENYASSISIVNNLKGRNDKKYCATCHEYMVIYCKPKFILGGLPLSEAQRAEYKYIDSNGERYALRDLRKRGSGDRREDRPNMYYPVYWDKESSQISLSRMTDNDVEIIPLRGDGSEGRWRWGPETFSQHKEIVEPSCSERTGKFGLRYRVYLNTSIPGAGDEDDDGEMVERTSKPKSIWIGPELSTDVAKRNFKEVLSGVQYDYPKSIGLLEKCLHLGSDSNGIVLDFFAGSGTTAHAVLDLNKQDGGDRKFILVQLPEPTGRSDYPTIADITKERVRRVIKKLNDEDAAKQLSLLEAAPPKQDRGFRVFKLAESNFKPWNADVPHDAETLQAQLFDHVNHIRSDRTQDDILYELLLKSGFPLTTPVEKLTMEGKTVFSVADGALLICLERALTMELIRAMAATTPERVVCLDEGFAGNDQLKANAVQIFKTKGVTKFQTV